MFGIGASELIIIGLAVVVFVKPEDLPGFFRKVAKIVAQAKKIYNEALSVKDQFIKEIENAASLEEAPRPQSRSAPEQGTPGEPEKPASPDRLS